jgi:hypothetical protein
VGVVGAVGETGVVGDVACGNGVVTKGVSAVVLLANPTFGQRSKLAVSVKCTALARTTPVWRIPELD